MPVSFKKITLIFIACIFGLLNNSAMASCTISSEIISASCSDSIDWHAGNITVNSVVTISGEILQSSAVGTFLNNGTISGGSSLFIDSGTVESIINNGSITGSSNAIYIYYGTVESIVNNGNIGSTTPFTDGIYNYSGHITTLTNNGTLLGGNPYYGGIYNDGSIDTFNNIQGNASGAVVYMGNLPSQYHIIIRSPAEYGQLTAGLFIDGQTTFGIYAGGIDGVAASTVARHRYTSVLEGFSISNLSNTSGSYNGFNWSLIETDTISGIWDLLITGASTLDTQSSVHNSAQRMRSIFSTAAISTNFANMNTYDCNLFDTKGMCISAGGRYTTVDNPSANSSSAVVVVGYKASPNIRIGGFLDQNFNNTTPTGIHIANKNPMMGAFAVWNQQEDGSGIQVKVANAYQDKDVTTTRDVIGTSEAGTGSTKLNTQSYVGELSYAFTFKDNTLVRPYLALRHTTIKQDAYTEDTTVTAPLTYAALEDKSTAALLGIKLNQALTPKANLTASLGIEQDLSHKVDQYAASGVSGLTSENFNDNIKHTRPVASLGAYYALTKTQRISGDVYYQQLPFQSTGSTAAYFNYTVGL